MTTLLIKNAKIINEGKQFKGSVLIKDDLIEEIYSGEPTIIEADWKVIDASGKLLIPGVIDDQVHFRDPGMPQKGDLFTESRAAVAGGTTSFMDMPNVKPQTLTQELLAERYELGAKKSLANYSFYMGASNTNLEEVIKTNPKNVCGIKIFMGSSTGNMLVDDIETLSQIFEKAPLLIATHCENSPMIDANLETYRKKYGDDISMEHHGKIRSAEACYKSSSKAIELAKKYNTRLHILHLSSGIEMDLFDNKIPSKDKKITAEVCVHHLRFNDSDYASRKARIKWNPAIKTANDQNKLWEALLDDRLDVVATDHAPHTVEEKDGNYMQAAGGGPLVQHSLVTMLEFAHQGKLSFEKVIEKMCHAPADIFQVEKRGYIRKGYFADLVLLSENEWTVNKENILYKCAWSPFEGDSFHYKVEQTFVNGKLVYNQGKIDNNSRGKRLTFTR
ncbi:dihydroorotase [Ancylomarina sp. 16SWW S1-10-2]|uniref:dihydroorotase n=1 Tax=Ancylomarina sp. 16SWW S1-10-2 TaxID=2499681 RepID=UPI0012ADABFD|nr:dihydroorotase [Ancylomarina sp. 16SWW S1-10-2]MRT91564.1 dihydroorotase [Ancylomarina sp. 16SWW S1-10-2]